MTTTETRFVPALASPDFESFAVRQAIAGFLAGYGDTTRQAYNLDLRQWLHWYDDHDLRVFDVRRAHIELFARSLEAHGKAKATVARRLSTVTGFYRYCFEEQLIPISPAAYVRRPRVDYESHATGLDRNELGMFLVQAGLCGGRDHALACLLALNGLRISEALNADIEQLGLERGHRTLVSTRKGGKIVTIPLAPHTARAIDLCVGEREDGPILLNHDGTRRLDRHAATRIVKRLARRGDRQEHLPALTQALVHHRSIGCRSGVAGCPRSGITRRPENNDALRPGPPIVGPSCHLHRRHLPSRSQPLTGIGSAANTHSGGAPHLSATYAGSRTLAVR